MIEIKDPLSIIDTFKPLKTRENWDLYLADGQVQYWLDRGGPKFSDHAMKIEILRDGVWIEIPERFWRYSDPNWLASEYLLIISRDACMAPIPEFAIGCYTDHGVDLRLVDAV